METWLSAAVGESDVATCSIMGTIENHTGGGAGGAVMAEMSKNGGIFPPGIFVNSV